MIMGLTLSEPVAIIDANRCDVVSPKYCILEAVFCCSQKTWYAQQQYGAATIISDSNTEQVVRTPAYVIGNKAKYFIVINNRELVLNLIAHSRHWIVFYACQDGEGVVIVMTGQKSRNERLIAEATREARKVVRLPSPTKDLHCDSTDL
nr:unnamed protein product [Callosobruchus analis]